MNIEIHAPYGQVKEWIVSYTEEQLMKLYRRDKEISRVQVHFKSWNDGENDYMVCEIDVTIQGHSLFVHRRDGTYDGAMRKALAELNQKIDEYFSKTGITDSNR